MIINQIGVLTIYFSDYLEVPKNLSVINKTSLEIILIPSNTSLINFLNFTWNLTSFTSKYLKLKINFEHPLYVSS